MNARNWKFLSQFIVIIFLSSGCAAIQKKIDLAGLEEIADDIQKDFDPGSRERLLYLLEDFSLEENTRPIFTNNIQIEALDRWEIEPPLGKELVMEKITFPSLIEHKNGKDTATFYVYKQGDFKERDVILWVPGMAVSDLAFFFIKRFFYEKLKREVLLQFSCRRPDKFSE